MIAVSMCMRRPYDGEAGRASAESANLQRLSTWLLLITGAQRVSSICWKRAHPGCPPQCDLSGARHRALRMTHGPPARLSLRVAASVARGNPYRGTGTKL